MFDKMKALMDMQKKLKEVKSQLESTDFDVESQDGLVRIRMSASQKIKEVGINSSAAEPDKKALEEAIKEVFSRGIKRSQEIAAEKMKGVTGFDPPSAA